MNGPSKKMVFELNEGDESNSPTGTYAFSSTAYSHICPPTTEKDGGLVTNM